MSEQSKKFVEGSAEEIKQPYEGFDRNRRTYEERQARLDQMQERTQNVLNVGNVISLAAVAVGMFAVSKRLDGIETLMRGLRENGVQITTTTAKHLAEHADEITTGMAR